MVEKLLSQGSLKVDVGTDIGMSGQEGRVGRLLCTLDWELEV